MPPSVPSPATHQPPTSNGCARSAAALGHAVRSGDTAVRIGDNLFAIILFNTAGTEVLAFTERLRTCLPPCGRLDFTIGTATSPADSTDPAALHRMAGSRLLEKKQGTPA